MIRNDAVVPGWSQSTDPCSSATPPIKICFSCFVGQGNYLHNKHVMSEAAQLLIFVHGIGKELEIKVGLGLEDHGRSCMLR